MRPYSSHVAQSQTDYHFYSLTITCYWSLSNSYPSLSHHQFPLNLYHHFTHLSSSLYFSPPPSPSSEWLLCIVRGGGARPQLYVCNPLEFCFWDISGRRKPVAYRPSRMTSTNFWRIAQWQTGQERSPSHITCISTFFFFNLKMILFSENFGSFTFFGLLIFHFWMLPGPRDDVDARINALIDQSTESWSS